MTASQSAAAPRPKPRVVAVSSGKGGVGKTNVAVNLALSLRLLGAQVLLLDAGIKLIDLATRARSMSLMPANGTSSPPSP